MLICPARSRTSAQAVPATPFVTARIPVKAAASTGGEAYARRVSVAENPDGSSHLTVVAPYKSLERARPLPSDDDMAIEGLTDEEWDAFEQALADR